MGALGMAGQKDPVLGGQRAAVQFVKTLRLYEAQRLMVRLGWNVSDTAAAVGYESSPQFIREYKRLFGEPPMKDVKRLETQDGPGIVRVI